MKIIGITGSYGKTSTKEILSTLLGSKYKTLKTKASKNSPIGIAETILSDLQPDHEAFVVEMGAYRPGEIRKMCEMVRPQIGIITAINAQHQDLFGTIETTMKAKYELVQGLVGDKIALFNRDNSHVYQMSQWAKKDHVRVHYFSTQDNTTDVGYRAGNIMSSEKGISFTLSINNQKKSVTAPLIGIHQASNIVAAAGAASVCGLTLAEIVSACRFIVPFEKTMKIIHGPTGATYIDDTFNNNPDAAIAAITYLKSTKRKKILVFQPMIELGNFTDESHKRVGAFAARVCDEIILTNDNYFEPFKEGVVSAAPTCSLHVLETSAAISHLKKILSSGDTVLFKGKEAAHVLSGLLQS
jgi:UDP-N-acetylmuramoyl-tripeptide--D-alanyl-D-alanine ligase